MANAADPAIALAIWSFFTRRDRFGLLAISLLIVLDQDVFAQMNTEGGVAQAESTSTVIPGVGSYRRPSAESKGANTAASQRGLLIEPSVALSTTYTNNAKLASVDRRSDVIVEVRPSIRIVSNGGAVRGTLDYSLRSFAYVNGTSDNRLQNVLNTRGSVEIVSDRAFVDFGGSISREAISAFGVQTADSSRVSANTAQQSRYNISPYVRGRIDELANYEIRYSHLNSFSDAQQASDGDVQINTWRATANKEYPGKKLGWSLEASSENIDYKVARSIQADRLRGVFTLIASPQIRMHLSGGSEANNYTSLDDRNYANWGAGLRWYPTDRTAVEADSERRFFGEGHRFSFNHRMERTAWRLSDIKDVSVGRGLESIGSQGTLYEVLFDQFASVEPDPTRRAQLVNSFLQANGLNANTVDGFLQLSATIQRRQQLTFSIIGLRNTITLVADRSKNTKMNGSSIGSGDFTNSDMIKQRGVGINVAHALSPTSTLSVLLLSRRASGSLEIQDSSIDTYTATYTTKFSSKAAFSAGARHTHFKSAVNPYSESAVFGQLTVRF